MAKIIVQLSKGLQFPASLGTLMLKETAVGRLAYAENVDSFNDKYGNGVITPGPSLQPINNTSVLTGVPFAKAFYGSSAFDIGFIWFLEGISGIKNIIRRIKDVVSGSSPSIDTTSSTFLTATHNSHLNPTLTDIIFRPDSSNNWMYVTGKDDSDVWVQKFQGGSPAPNLSLIATNTDFVDGLTDPFLVLGADNNLYWIAQRRVSVIDTSDNYSPLALLEGLPIETYASAGVDWNQTLVVAYSTDAFGDFGRRFSAGHSGVIIWDYSSDAFNKRIPAPCRYISVLVPLPNGNLICFGGIDEGKSSIYEFTGFGFNLLYSYIGDLPKSRHSIEFDGQGRILFHTADGKFCRFDIQNQIFDVLGNTDSQGGMLAKAIGSPTGNEFLLASGPNYTVKTTVFGNFVGNARAISGIQTVPFQSSLNNMTWHLTRPLESGQKVSLLVYRNSSSTPEEWSVMDFSIDGAIVSKNETKTFPKTNNFSLEVLWELPDNQSTAPAVLPVEVEYT